jgi:hypothetical protein
MSQKTAHTTLKTYISHDSVRFVVSQSSIVLFDTHGYRIRTIEYPQAAVWDFICRNYGYDRMVQLLMIINRCSEENARSIIDDFIEELLLAKILVEVDING